MTKLSNRNYKSYHLTDDDTIVKEMILLEELNRKYKIFIFC